MPGLLQLFLDFLAQLCTAQQAAQLPVYDSLTRMLCHLCYQRPWWQKVAGCVGLQVSPAPTLRVLLFFLIFFFLFVITLLSSLMLLR